MATQQWRPGKRVIISGGGPGAVSAALAFLSRGFDVRVYEKQPECKAIGGAVLLSTPVLAILRSYGIDISQWGEHVVTYFKNGQGHERVQLPFNAKIEKQMGIKGWHRGILRSSAFQQMLDLVPEGVIQTGHEFESYVETDDGVEARFKNGETVLGDILVGADGIRSGVSRQAFGDPKLFHTGIRLYLAWCEQIPDMPPNYGVLHHNWQYQFSFFPMVHNGRPGFEWWTVEPSWEGKPVPEDIESHVRGILEGFPEPSLRFADATNFDTQVYRWEIYNRPSMKKWSAGRIVCLGDAIHPVSPYAAYGMGMAIEDGYYLARALDGVDLRKSAEVTAGFSIYEGERVDYVNHNMEFARFLGRVFHGLPWPLAWIRDCIFDYTPFLSRMMRTGYLKKAEEETIGLKELQVTQ